MKANWHLYIFYLVLALSVMVKGPVSVGLIALYCYCAGYKRAQLEDIVGT